NYQMERAPVSEQARAIVDLGLATQAWVEKLSAVDVTAKDADKQIAGLIATVTAADGIEMGGLLAALEEIREKTPELAALIEKELVGVIQKLDSQQLATLQASLRQAYENGTISAEQFAERSAAVVESAAKQMGISLKEALGELTPATEKALRNLDTMMDGMKAMGKTTEEQGKAAEEALSKAFSGAKTKADLDAIIADVKRLGDEGTLTAEQIKDLEKTYTESMRKMAVETSGLTAAEKELAAAFDARYAALKQQEAQAQQSRLAQAKLNSETARTSQALDEASTSADEAAVSIDVVGKACRRAGRDMNDLADGADAVAQAYRDTMNAVLDTMNGPMNPIEFSRFYARAMKEAEFAASEKAAAIANLNDRLRANEQANNNAARGVAALEMRLLELTASEEEVARARAERDKTELQMQIEKNRIEAERARITGNEDEARRLGEENALLQRQIGLLDQIQRAEAKQRQERASEKPSRAESGPSIQPTIEPVKTVNVNIGSQRVRVLAGDEDALLAALESARGTAA
ncbi:MAG: hypothetical protein ACNA7T_05115, partial [Haliea sp.]